MARSAFPYAGWVPSAVRAFKYGDEWSRGADLAKHMATAISALGPVDLIVPVPLHGEKLKARGYNQSQMLAEELAKTTGTRCLPVISRTRATAPQVSLDREARQANVRGAFALDTAYAVRPGLRYLLVDDVRTTCSTINECALVLTQLAPARISVATLAIDLPTRELQSWLDEHGT